MTNTIAFPGPGIEFTVNRVAFHIFSRPVYWYALIIMSGFCIALAFVAKTCKKRGVSPDTVFDIAFWGLIFGIAGARIYYVIFDPACLDGNIFNVVKIWEGGLAIYGGIIAAAAVAFIYCRRHSLPVLKTFDVFAPGLLIGQAVGRWGNFVNAEVYGRESNGFLRMSINSAPAVHPLFLYESVWNVAGLIIILLFRDKKKADGQVFFFYTLWYGTGRLFLEGMRRSDYILYLIDGKLGVSQAVSAVAIAVSAVMLVYLGKKGTAAVNGSVNVNDSDAVNGSLGVNDSSDEIGSGDVNGSADEIGSVGTDASADINDSVNVNDSADISGSVNVNDSADISDSVDVNDSVGTNDSDSKK